jgi:hypothetical protein
VPTAKKYLKDWFFDWRITIDDLRFRIYDLRLTIYYWLFIPCSE